MLPTSSLKKPPRPDALPTKGGSSSAQEQGSKADANKAAALHLAALFGQQGQVESSHGDTDPDIATLSEARLSFDPPQPPAGKRDLAPSTVRGLEHEHGLGQPYSVMNDFLR